MRAKYYIKNLFLKHNQFEFLSPIREVFLRGEAETVCLKETRQGLSFVFCFVVRGKFRLTIIIPIKSKN